MQYISFFSSKLILIGLAGIMLIQVGASAQSNPNNPNFPVLRAIAGKIFIDSNKDGIDNDNYKYDCSGIFINTIRDLGTTQAQYMVKSDCNYYILFPEGNFQLEFSAKGLTPTKKGTLAILNDSDINANAKTDFITLNKEVSSEVIANAGFVINETPKPKEAILGNYIWKDVNNNGKQDENEKGINGINVQAFISGTNTLVNSYTSHTNGFYQLVLPAGKYDIKFLYPTNLKPALKNNAFNNNDSNIDDNGKIVGLDLFAGEVNNDYDAGFIDAPPKQYQWSDLGSLIEKYINGIKNKNQNDIKTAIDAITQLFKSRFGW